MKRAALIAAVSRWLPDEEVADELVAAFLAALAGEENALRPGSTARAVVAHRISNRALYTTWPAFAPEEAEEIASALSTAFIALLAERLDDGEGN